MSHVQLYVLGTPRLEWKGTTVYADTQKAIALLVYLALNGTCLRAELTALLWPELPTIKAQNALRRTLSSLRKTIGRERVVANRFTVGLATEVLSSLESGGQPVMKGVWTDVAAFRALLAQNTSQSLAAATALYRGDFLAGFSLRDTLPFDEWQSTQARLLRREAVKACETLTRMHTERQEWETAVRCGQQWLDLDPLHEPAHRQLMVLYVQQGARSAALCQYQRCQELLQSELGVAPVEETTQLYRQILANRIDLPIRHIRKQNEVELYEAIGDLQVLLGQYEAAIQHYETALASSPTNLLATLHHKLGRVYSRQGRWESAEQQLTKALHLAIGNKLTVLRGRILANLSWVYIHQKEMERPFALAQESLTLAGQANDKQTLALAHNVLGFWHSHENQYDQARKHLEQALAAARLQENKSLLAAVLNNLALFYSRCGDLGQALELAEKGLIICTAHGDRHCKAALHNNLADLLYKAGNRKTAVFHVKQAVAIYTEIGMTGESVQMPIWDFRVW